MYGIFYRIKDLFTRTGAAWDKLAPAEESAKEYAHKYINPEPERMIAVHHYSMEYCLAHYGEVINERFREDRPIDIDQQIADMVSQHETKKDLVLYRGVCKAVYQMMKENASNIKGTDLLEKSFLQTSLIKGQESNSKIHLRIFVPAGTKAVYLGNVNDEQWYYEVDLQHGAHLQIVSIDKKYINCKLLVNQMKSCGCISHPNIIGKRYGRLVVMSDTGYNDANGNRKYDCLCDCGNHKIVTAHDLNFGDVKSCGCMLSDSGKRLGNEYSQKYVEKYCVEGTNVTSLSEKKGEKR